MSKISSGTIPGALGIRLEEELPYSVLRKIGNLEIRHYPPFTLARVEQTGSFEETRDSGFRLLADFIFGENSETKKTSMTTPVFQDRTSDGWVMSFYMPPESAAMLPKNPEVWIEDMPDKTVAVHRYSGNNDMEKMEAAKALLLEEIRVAGLRGVSHVWWAQYDQPFALPVMKRNEVLVKIESIS
ncbi:MAG TPA: heme-binding protein [Bacteriovoracaceae bacterium]|nr:heme-binding protein [Bacteriovoracaceae bacterium]